MNLTALCTQSHEIAKKSGFLDPPQTWEEVIALIHSELSEALEEYRKHRALNEAYYEFKVPGVANKEAHTFETLSRDEYLALTPDARKGGKPCGIPSEFADVVIRMAQYCGTIGWDLQKAYDENVRGKVVDKGTFLQLISGGHCYISSAYMSQIEVFPSRAVVYFALLIGELEQFCERNDINLSKAIEEKALFNSTRSFRHGGKKV